MTSCDAACETGAPAGRNRDRLRVALEGIVERHPAEPRSAARGHPRRTRRTRPARCRGSAPTVRTGDTSASERQQAFRKPPHILVTTPESLYVLLGSASGRSDAVDRAHGDRRRNPRGGRQQARQPSRAVARTARRRCARQPPARASASRPRKSRSSVARFRVARVDGDDRADCAIVDIGYARERDLALELPPTPLEAVMSNEQWEQVYERARGARRRRIAPTLVFVNTRRMAERAARHLGRAARQGRGRRASRQPRAANLRLDAEQRLKRGELQGARRDRFAGTRASISATSISVLPDGLAARRSLPFLQRVGPLGPRGRRHAEGAAASARRATIWSNARRCSTACAAANSMRCAFRVAPLDVLAQQIVAEVAAANGTRTSCSSAACAARHPTRDLTRSEYDAVAAHARRGLHEAPRPARARYVHRDAVHRRAARHGAARSMTARHVGRHDSR